MSRRGFLASIAATLAALIFPARRGATLTYRGHRFAVKGLTTEEVTKLAKATKYRVYRLTLEPVGKNWTGEFYPIGQLRYAPRSGNGRDWRLSTPRSES